MKIFFDTEFTGLHKNTTLISIGLIAETGHTFYAELTDYDNGQVDDWLQENVIENLLPLTKTWNENPLNCEVLGNKRFVAESLKRWFNYMKNISFDDSQLELWSDCLAYDWVLFNDLFGHAFNIPDSVYYIPFDLSTAFKIKGIDPDISREAFAFENSYKESVAYGEKHNALWDAMVIKQCYEKLFNPSWQDIAVELLNEKRELWEKLAKV